MTDAAVVIFGGLAFHKVRRKHFELFYYSHHFAFVVYIAVLFHAASAWYFVMPGILLYAVDRAIRFTNGARLPSVFVLPRGGATMIEFRYDGLNAPPRAMLHTAGQYCFVNVPAVSALEWHPFTISSAPGDAASTIHAKSMGDSTFTARLAELAASDAQPVVRIDGPYGKPPQFEEFDDVLLVAGGIGITPCHAILRDLYLRRCEEKVKPPEAAAARLPSRVHLIWSVRHRGMACLFTETWKLVNDDSFDGNFRCAPY